MHKSADEVGDMDMPFISELLEYWSEYPPEHLLLRGFVGYKGTEDRKDLRMRRAEQMGDENPKDVPPELKEQLKNPVKILSSGDARHADCAPGHIQAAIERAKSGEHLKGPQ